MERGSLDKLKYDNRLRRRQGWIDTRDDEAYLAELPDVGAKVHVGEEDSPPEAAFDAAAVAPDSPPSSADAPVSQPLDPQPPPFEEIAE